MIKNYILTIAATVLFCAIAENLMPDGNIKKHISLVVGLVILYAIANPLIDMPEFLIDGIKIELNESSDISSKKINSEIERTSFEIIDNSFSEALENAIENSIENNFGVKKSVNVNSQNGEIVSTVIQGERNQNIESFIRQNFGLNCTFSDNR